VRGPEAPEATPRLGVIRVRRYRCQRCEAVITVVPREVLARKHFSGAAIALAIALFGHCGLPARQVRTRVSPWRMVGAAAHASWASLRRWITAAINGRLFPGMTPRSWPGTWRQRAAKLAAVLSAYAPVAMRGAPLEEQAFYAGGALMA
jgi:hypothetical protein